MASRSAARPVKAGIAPEANTRLAGSVPSSRWAALGREGGSVGAVTALLGLSYSCACREYRPWWAGQSEGSLAGGEAHDGDVSHGGSPREQQGGLRPCRPDHHGDWFPFHDQCPWGRSHDVHMAWFFVVVAGRENARVLLPSLLRQGEDHRCGEIPIRGC